MWPSMSGTRLTETKKPVRLIFSIRFNSTVTEIKKESPQEERGWLSFRQLGRLGTDLSEFDSKVLEILLGEGEEEAYNTEWFVAEENRRKLDVNGKKSRWLMTPADGAERENFVAESHIQS